MNWLKVVRACRGGVWGLAAALALWTIGIFEQRMLRFDISAMQQSARATVGVFELLGLLIIAVAFDRVLELRERGMLEKAAKRATA